MQLFEQVIFYVVYVLYGIAMLNYWVYALTHREGALWMGARTLRFAVILHTVDFALRTYIGFFEIGLKWYVPWSNWFESFSLFAFAIGVTFWIAEKKTKLVSLGVFVATLLWTILTFSLCYPFFSGRAVLSNLPSFFQSIEEARAIPHLMPALQSFWMAIHVPMMFVSYAAFAVAFCVGIVYLIQQHQLKSKHPSEFAQKLPSLETLDQLIYRLVAIGFPVLTLGVILGARWAYDAWGRYWGWDAKETWAFITWLVYAIYLHMRLVMNWRGRKTVLLSVAAFGVVLFTYIGVNYLSQLHGFLSGRGM